MLNSDKSLPTIVVIVGPTASGKTALGIQLAHKLNGEIISADSRQVYRGMDIGTGKVTVHEMEGVPHHLLDVASPRRSFSVTRFQKLGRAAIKTILKKGKLPIIVGGTGLYIDALTSNTVFPEVKPNLKLRKELEKKSLEELYDELKRLDPNRAAAIDRKNKRRLIRALEIITTTGQPVPRPDHPSSPYHVITIGINPGQEIIKTKIKKRLLERLDQGMIEEVERLHTEGLSWQRLNDFGLEYRWISRYLQGLLTENQMIEKLESEINHYAKRQMTWFKRNKETRWIANAHKALEIIKRAVGRADTTNR